MANTKTTQEYVEVLSSPSSDVRTTQEYVEVLSSVENPHSRVTQEYVEVLSSRVTEQAFRPFPYLCKLGTETWTVQIAERGGERVLLEAAATQAGLGRRLDDLAQIGATFAQSSVSGWCLDAISELEAWTHELILLRGDELVGVGPIADGIVFTRSSVVVKARDLFQWMERRVLPIDRTFKDRDLSRIFEQGVLDALSRDRSPNITIDSADCGTKGSRVIRASEYKYASDFLRDLADIAVDFATIGRTIRIRGEDGGDHLGVLDDAHVVADSEPSLDLNGLVAASEWILQGTTPTGATDPLAGRAGGIDPRIGLVQRVSQDTAILDVTELRKGAKKLQRASGTAPLKVTVRLSKEAPWAFNDLVPGNTFDCRLSFGRKSLETVMRLDAVNADVKGPGQETISIDLVRGSDAEAA